MTKPACPRWFEAEALRDGRLAGAERLSFQRHLDSCPHCSREVAALQALGDRLCNSGRRGRRRRASRAPRTDAPTGRFRRDARAARTHESRSRLARGGRCRVTALARRVFGYFRARSAVPAGTESAVVVHAEGTASWSRRSEGAVEKILLERGVLSIRVDHSRERRRLLVVLPDGELEDIGTRFTVSAEASRTTRVSVESGSVVLRIRGQAPLSLGAGETWHPSQPADVSACPSCEPPRVAGAASPPPARANPAPASPRADGSACPSCEPPRVAGPTSLPPAPLGAALGRRACGLQPLPRPHPTEQRRRQPTPQATIPSQASTQRSTRRSTSGPRCQRSIAATTSRQPRASRAFSALTPGTRAAKTPPTCA